MKRLTVEQMENLQAKIEALGQAAAQTAAPTFLTHLGKSPSGAAKLTIVIDGEASETGTEFKTSWTAEHKEKDSDKLDDVYIDDNQTLLEV